MKIVRSVRICVLHPGNRGRTTRVYRAPNGHGFSDVGVDQILSRAAEHLEKQMPDEEYRLVPVVGGFNFVHVGKRLAQESIA